MLARCDPYALRVTPYELEVRAAEQPGLTVVELAGELDLTNVPEIERRLEQLGADGALAVDLNRVTFIDSAALHMLFRVARSQDVHAARFGIVLEPTAAVYRTLSIVNLEAVTTISSSVEGLVAAGVLAELT
jgi:anti-anti-sigma factor